jgi:hypothetical protein
VHLGEDILVKMRKPHGPQSEEHRKHNKEAKNLPQAIEESVKKAKERWKDPIYRENQNVANAKPGVREKRINAIKEAAKRPEVKEKQSKASIINNAKPEVKEKQSKSRKISWENPKRRKRGSEVMKEKWRDPVWKANQIIAVGKGLEIKPNKPETHLQTRFFIWQPKITYSGDYSVVINGKNPDFICFEKKKIIEFNGNWWHRNDAPGLREEIFAEWGYDTLILVDEDLLDDHKLKTKVDAFMERPNPYINIGVI